MVFALLVGIVSEENKECGYRHFQKGIFRVL